MISLVDLLFMLIGVSFGSVRSFHRFVLYTHLWERKKQLKHTPYHLIRPSDWGRRLALPKELVLGLHMGFCFVPGHCFCGMLAYLSGIGTRMAGKHSRPSSMCSSVDCKPSRRKCTRLSSLYILLIVLSFLNLSLQCSWSGCSKSC